MIETGPLYKKEVQHGKHCNEDGIEKSKVLQEREARKMAYDDILLHIGEFGRYQRRICLLLFLPAILSAFHSMAGVFLGAQPDFRCLLPHESSENATYQLPSNHMDVAHPWDNTTNNWSQCQRYDFNLTDQYYDMERNLASTNATVKCDAFVYDTRTYELTTTTEFNLVCDDAWLKPTADSLLMVGIMLGALFFGGLSDKYGRRPTLCLAILVNFISGLIVAGCPEVISYMIFRLILGISVNAMYLIAYVNAVEMVIPERRLMIGVSMQLFFTLGYIITTGFAYFVTNWRILQVVITIPSLAFLTYWWFIPESVRWLLTKGHLQKAKELILKASLQNRVELPKAELDRMLQDDSVILAPDLKKPSVVDLFRYPNLRRKSLLLFFTWFVNSGTSYGLSWNSSSLGGNDYLNSAISGFVEVPAHAFVFFTLNRFGRKIMLCGCMVLAGTSLISTIFVPTEMQWLVVLCVMIGKFAITASFGIVYIFSAEQYPTVIRNVGVGACSTSARIGGVVAPYILHLSSTSARLPYVIFGTSAVIAGLLALLLPETLNEKLPESIQDGEAFGKKK